MGKIKDRYSCYDSNRIKDKYIQMLESRVDELLDEVSKLEDEAITAMEYTHNLEEELEELVALCNKLREDNRTLEIQVRALSADMDDEEIQ